MALLILHDTNGIYGAHMMSAGTKRLNEKRKKNNTHIHNSMLWIKISLVELLLLYVLLLNKCFRIFIGLFLLEMLKNITKLFWIKNWYMWNKGKERESETEMKMSFGSFLWNHAGIVFNCNAFPSTTYFYLLIEILMPMWFNNTKQLRKHALLSLYKKNEGKYKIIALKLIFLHLNAFQCSGDSDKIMMIIQLLVA